MNCYVIDVKERKWVVLCLENHICGKTISVVAQPFYFGRKREAINFAKDKSGEYLVYIYKRVKTLSPWCKRLADLLFSEV